MSSDHVPLQLASQVLNQIRAGIFHAARCDRSLRAAKVVRRTHLPNRHAWDRWFQEITTGKMLTHARRPPKFVGPSLARSSMTKAELIERIARSRDLPPDISKKLIGQILGLAFDELASYFARARVTRSQSPRFTFPHFGTFTKKRRSARRGVNPRTLEPIQIEACDTVDFKASRELRETMNPGRSADSDAADAPVAAAKKAAKAKSKTKTKAKAKSRTRTATKKKAARKTTTSKTTRRRTAGARTSVAGPTKRPLTPRDDAELSPLLTLASTAKGAAAAAPEGATAEKRSSSSELPEAPMQRVKGKRRSRSRGTG